MNKNIYYFSEVLASILYYYNKINNADECNDLNIEFLLNKIGLYDLKFWINNALFTKNMNRTKIIYDFCLKYNIVNKDILNYDQINDMFYDLNISDNEVKYIYNSLKKYLNIKFKNI